MISINTIEEKILTGERALFKSDHLSVSKCIFQDGESPLKESSHLAIDNTSFKWKYPLWYCNDVTVTDSILFETARSGIWYTNDIQIINTIIEAPKTFRRAKNIELKNVQIPNGEETMWSCDGIVLGDVMVKGDYFAKDSSNIKANGLNIFGDYAFDGCKNVTVRNAKLLSKDAFWNCENVTIFDSYISGAYLGWNSKNLTFINCTIESLQGLCYIENLVMKDCNLLNTTLAFEYSSIDVEVDTAIISVKSPLRGKIRAKQIGELILDDPTIDHELTCIDLMDVNYAV